jgi:hypothetical protein
MSLAQIRRISQLALDPRAVFGSDSVVGAEDSSGTPRPDLAGSKVRAFGDDTLFLIDRHGYRRRIPFPVTFIHLFQDSTFHAIRTMSSVAEIAQGPAFDDDALLLRGAASEQIYLLDGVRKRRITSRRVMEKYGFNEAAVVVAPQAVVNALREGEVWE